MKNTLEVQFGGLTSAGKQERNQDAFAVFEPAADIVKLKGVGMCVADGVSSSNNAHQASSMTVTHFLQDYFSTPDTWDVKSAAAKVLSSLNAWLFHHSQQATAKDNALVTTFSGAILKGQSAHIFHVGDSRIYLWRDNVLEQLTRDHVHTGSGQAFLSRALGMDMRLEVDYHQRDIRKNDVFLISTDGLHAHLSREQLVNVLSNISAGMDQAALENECRKLLDLAANNGSTANASCVLLRVNAVPDREIQEVRREAGIRRIPPVLQAGESLDHFLIQDLVMSTRRSHVYRVVNKRDGRTYALKAPSGNFQNDQAYLESFVREQWVGSHLSHRNLMKILPDNPESVFMYHICEWVEGINLRQWMHDHPRAELPLVREIVDQVIQGLRAMQRMGMVHRDLKPENIMITPAGVVKILDFGCTAARGLRELNVLNIEDIPKTSLNYLAPEYLIEGTFSTQCDIFALAVIMYEMLTGDVPFDLEAIMARKARKPGQWKYRSLRNVRPDLPLWLDLALAKGCEGNRSQRYVAYSELRKDLHEPNQSLLDNHGLEPMYRRDPLKFWQLSAAGLAVLVILEGIWIALN